MTVHESGEWGPRNCWNERRYAVRRWRGDSASDSAQRRTASACGTDQSILVTTLSASDGLTVFLFLLVLLFPSCSSDPEASTFEKVFGQTKASAPQGPTNYYTRRVMKQNDTRHTHQPKDTLHFRLHSIALLGNISRRFPAHCCTKVLSQKKRCARHTVHSQLFCLLLT